MFHKNRSYFVLSDLKSLFFVLVTAQIFKDLLLPLVQTVTNHKLGTKNRLCLLAKNCPFSYDCNIEGNPHFRLASGPGQVCRIFYKLHFL